MATRSEPGTPRDPAPPKGGPRAVVLLARPRIPSVEAPALQVLGTASGLASHGVDAHVLHDGDGSDALAFHGVAPSRHLHLHRLRRGLPGALAWRLQATALSWQGAWVLARDWRRLDALRGALGGPVVLEVHDLPTVDAAPSSLAAAVALERRVLARVVGVVAVSDGALSLLRARHGRLPPTCVCPNGAAGPRPPPSGPGVGVGYVGSARAFKGLGDLADAAARLPFEVTLVGPQADDPEVASAIARSGGRLRVEGPLAPAAVPERLARFRVLVLPLSPGVFGASLTSPLKLWDYLAAGRPIVAADLPTVSGVAPGAFVPYAAGDPASLARALVLAHDDEATRAAVVAAARVRTWGDRAAELLAFFADVAP